MSCGEAEVLLDPAGHLGQRPGLVVGQAGPAPQAGGHGLGRDPRFVRPKIMEAELCADPPPGDLARHLATVKPSGVTSPATRAEPSPQVPSMATTHGRW